MAAAVIMTGCTEMEGMETTLAETPILEKRIYVGITGDRDILEEKNVFEVGDYVSFVMDNAEVEFGSEPIKINYALVDGEYENIIHTFEMGDSIDPAYVWFHQEIGMVPEPGKFVLRAYVGEELFGEVYFEVEEHKIESFGEQDTQI
jgi:hypothetical protein